MKHILRKVIAIATVVTMLAAVPAMDAQAVTIYTTMDSEELKKYKTHSEIIEAVASLDYISHIEEMN